MTKCLKLVGAILALAFLIEPCVEAQVGGSSRWPVAKEVPGTLADAPEGTFTVVVLPDTQFYAEYFPEVFRRQVEWVVKNREGLDIRFVLHEGDITDDNVRGQWEVARGAMGVLKEAGIPYVLAAGNHDMGPGGSTRDRSTLLNEYFSAADYGDGGDAGFFEEGRMENAWRGFETPWGSWLVIALEFGPRDEVLEWARRVAAGHAGDRVIVLTHSYMGAGEERTDSAKNYPGVKDGANGGDEMWGKFVSREPNVRLVLSGHVPGVGYRKDKGVRGNTVHQILADYQSSPEARHEDADVRPERSWGGGGYLRLLQFLPDGRTVRVRAYSPWYDDWLEEQEFEVVVE